MNKKLILLSTIDNKIKATPVSKEVLEAIVFISIRYGVKNMMIVNAQTNELLSGEQEYAAANDRGDTEAEVLSCDPESPAITSLAQFNNRSAGDIPKEYSLEDPNVFERDKGHSEHLPYADDAEFEGTSESYKKYGRVKPVYFVEFERDGRIVKAVVDGWKYVCFAKANGIGKVYACKLSVGNNDDLMSIMLQLQRGNHEAFLSLYYMIEGLWPKYYRGQGFRTDIKEEELDEAVLGADGRKLNIYERIGRELNLSGTKVKQIRKVAKINPLHFERIEIGRFSLFQAYQESVKEERGEMPPVPMVKAPVYHTNLTTPPVFSSPTTTGDPVSNEGENEAEVTAPLAANTTDARAGEIPMGNVVSMDDDYITVSGICQHCNKVTFLKIPKNQIYE